MSEDDTPRSQSGDSCRGTKSSRRNKQKRTGAGKGREELQSRNRGSVTGAIRRFKVGPGYFALRLSRLRSTVSDVMYIYAVGT